ncbi:MAG: serine/threonine-protein kinase, partial [Planctomycetota bacterium]
SETRRHEPSAWPANPFVMPQRKLRFLPTKATFNLGQRLGAGTVGVVYQATSPDIDVPVAVKILHPAVADDEAIVARFEREVVVTERMRHPHIIGHYGGGFIDGQLFYAMQLLEHGSLKDRLKQKGPLPWPQAAAYAAQIASALQHAHNHGVIHRDLKPSNLFFKANGDLVLGDFGIARDTHDADISGHGTTVGTYSYMSPEQITADEQLDGKADLYSLGCVLFEMLTGRLPFIGANFAQVWDQHLHKPPPSVAEERDIAGRQIDCPVWLSALITKLMAKDPADRPFNARAVQGMITQHLIDEFGEEGSRRITSEVELPSPLLTPERGQARPWVVAAVLAIVAAVIAAAAAWGN